MTFWILQGISNQTADSSVVAAGSLACLTDTTFFGVAEELNDQTYINSLTFFDNNLYAGTGEYGNLFAYESETWDAPNLFAFSSGSFTNSAFVVSNQSSVLGQVVFDDQIYSVGGTYGALLNLGTVTAVRPSLFELSGSTLTSVADVTSNQVSINGMVELSSALYGVSGNSGNLLRYT